MLAEILAHKQAEIKEAINARHLQDLEEAVSRQPAAKDFAGALQRNKGPLRLITELKQASPSKGLLRESFDPAALAAEYTAAGAAAISVLTDRKFFRGDLANLAIARDVTGLPLLRKDFIIHPYQVYESRAAGADAILLIAAILEPEVLAELYQLATSLGMACLVEVHAAGELTAVLQTEAQIIGINNRDLRTFTTDLAVTAALRPLIPPGRLVVSESGIATRSDMVYLDELHVDAALVGEALVRSPNPGAKVRELLGQD